MPNATGTLNSFYTTASETGALDTLINFFAPSANQFTQNIGTGNGSTVTFSFTLSNTTIADGQCRIRFRIAGVTYDVWENAEGAFVHPLISIGTLNKSTGAGSVTFTTAIDDTYVMTALYSTGSAGQDWIILLRQNSKDSGGSDAYASIYYKEVILKNSGISGKELVLFGIREFYYAAGSSFGWNLNIYNEWNEDREVNADWNYSSSIHGQNSYANTQEMWNNHPSVLASENNVAYKFYGNKGHIKGSFRSLSSIDTSFYGGFGTRTQSPSKYEFPLCCIGSSFGSGMNVSTQSNDHSFIADMDGRSTNNRNCFLMLQDNTVVSGNDFDCMPFDNFNNTGTLKGKPFLYPIYPYVDNNPEDILFLLDGVVYTPREGLQSGNTLTEGGDTYDVMQDVFRTDYNNFAAFKQE